MYYREFSYTPHLVFPLVNCLHLLHIYIYLLQLENQYRHFISNESPCLIQIFLVLYVLFLFQDPIQATTLHLVFKYLLRFLLAVTNSQSLFFTKCLYRNLTTWGNTAQLYYRMSSVKICFSYDYPLVYVFFGGRLQRYSAIFITSFFFFFFFHFYHILSGHILSA